MDHSEFFQLFNAYWWLIFVLIFVVARLGRTWSRHVQAQRTLDMMKTYVDQGKEPPPEMLRILQSGPDWRGVDWRDDRIWRRRCGGGWVSVFLFTALACGFGFMAWQTNIVSNGSHVHQVGLVFVAIIMVGLALGNLVSMLARDRAADLDRTLPK